MTRVGIFLPGSDELFLYGVTPKITSDCLVDRLVGWWEGVKEHFPHIKTLPINLDNWRPLKKRSLSTRTSRSWPIRCSIGVPPNLQAATGPMPFARKVRRIESRERMFQAGQP